MTTQIIQKMYIMNMVKRSVLAGFLALGVFAASTFLSYGDSLPMDSSGGIKWIIGPAKADLGNYGEIRIPDGFRFIGKEDAKVLLKQMNNPAPNALVGILAPISTKYMVVLEYGRVGYVKDDKGKLNSKIILESLRDKVDRQNASTSKSDKDTISSVDWEMEPQYDSFDHRMEWAIRAQTGSGKAINHIVRIFGREGMLDGTAVQSGATDEEVPLKELMAGVTFKPGHAYADYQEGDHVATETLAQLITSDDPADYPTNWRLIGYSVGGAVILILAIGGIMILKRKPANQNQTDYEAAPKAIKFLNGAPVTENHVNGNGAANGQSHSRKMRRRRVFDYQKYYTDLIFQVSDRAYEPDMPAPDRQETVVPQSGEAPNSNPTPHIAHLNLIEGQKRLIEEQQRLIHEQTKLIEEKTRLIQEKNEVLDKQSELFGNNSF